MSRYPLSVLEGSADVVFRHVLNHHLPQGGKVLDVTHGTGISWGGASLFDSHIELVASDLEPRGSKYTEVVHRQDIFKIAEERKDWLGQFDVVYYDPPWYVDIEVDSDDPREDDYGGYGAQKRTLTEYMLWTKFAPELLKPGGKLIVKCGDQYVTKWRRLALHHLGWCRAMEEGKLDLVDFYIYRNKRVSPTAFQVKDRPCSVVVHSYFIVGQKVGG